MNFFPAFQWKTIAFFCALVASTVVAEEPVEKQIEARIAEIRKEGLPISLDDLDRWYAQPTLGPNAADTFITAFAKITEVELPDRPLIPMAGDALMPGLTEPLPELMKRLSLQYLSDNQLALSLLHVSIAVKECRYPVRLTEGVNALLPHAQHARQAARLLALDALVQAEQGNGEDAVLALITGIGVARSLAREPILISRLVQIACQATTLSALERVENRMTLTEAQLGKLISVLTDSENPDGFVRAMVGEQCFGLSTFKMSPEELRLLVDGFSNDRREAQKLVEYLATPSATLSADRLAYLDIMRDTIKASQMSFPEALRVVAGSETKLNGLPDSYRLSRTMLPAMSNTFNRQARGIAQLRVARTALSIERYRLAKGNPPKTLDDLLPSYCKSVPVDPFDGQPLRYKKLAKGYIVYSIGDDMKDNRGTEKDATGKLFTNGTDITFTIER